MRRSRLDTMDTMTGDRMYNIAWECTPDAEAPLTTISQRDEMPLDRYIDEPLFSMLQKGRRGQRDTHRH